jgi:hypothetical protein
MYQWRALAAGHLLNSYKHGVKKYKVVLQLLKPDDFLLFAVGGDLSRLFIPKDDELKKLISRSSTDPTKRGNGKRPADEDYDTDLLIFSAAKREIENIYTKNAIYC